MDQSEYTVMMGHIEETAKDSVHRIALEIRADIARQLTRIADQGGSNRLFKKVVESAAKQYEQQSTPTPDTLVDAVKLIASMECGIHHHTGNSEIPCSTCVRMKGIAQDAQIKAVRDD